MHANLLRAVARHLSPPLPVGARFLSIKLIRSGLTALPDGEPLPEDYDPDWRPPRPERIRRFGVLARKVGMLPFWNAYGQYNCVTVLAVDNNHVLQVKQLPANASPVKGLSDMAVQIGAGFIRPYQAKRTHRFHCAYAGTDVKEKLVEFRVAPASAAEVALGTPITARHFAPGQYVDVTGTSIGKGFQGPMKRHGFHGQPASHGVSLAHRSHGATGQRQDPGRVFKGKKMAGHMGCKRVTVQNLLLQRIDLRRNLLYVSGHVPGHAGNWVMVRDAVKRSGAKWWDKLPHPPPFPTYVPSDDDDDTATDDVADLFAAPPGVDPFRVEEGKA
ncbi:hypothetical protein CDCA_CDCA02G0712 [Cyanidium caldarium]|uniref:Large ribosomal subunit protein uL3m n=1 Tax=Cyanidium caldarium TaxID=2771 RepID=A0AAV9IQN8_CYACA|nr:hypothetical protein CDCA_CDCA02G0712 [Cyanidium caldarium]